MNNVNKIFEIFKGGEDTLRMLNRGIAKRYIMPTFSNL